MTDKTTDEIEERIHMYQERIGIIKKELKDEKGQIARNEIADCQRSIQLIEFGQKKTLEKVKEQINIFQENITMYLSLEEETMIIDILNLIEELKSRLGLSEDNCQTKPHTSQQTDTSSFCDAVNTATKEDKTDLQEQIFESNKVKPVTTSAPVDFSEDKSEVET